jgi:hypothetical protein
MTPDTETPPERLRPARPPHKRPTLTRAFRCQCGRPVFFRNSQCLACGTPLGYDPLRSRLLPLQPGPVPGQWKPCGDALRAPLYRRCANFDSAAGCNWLIRVERRGERAGLCIACRLNRTIPDLGVPDNQVLWGRIETAKRRLVSQLVALKLPVRSLAEDPGRGLAFDLLRPTAEQPIILTGHAGGVITLNIEEADDAHRERLRTELREPYRTLLGHFRHEVGHYYWDRLVRDTSWHEPFRALFGDERSDYAAALQANYSQGPPADWPQRVVSAYAAVHPWEDWAETWAHYLHMRDTVDTALSFGFEAEHVELETDPWGTDALWQPEAPGAQRFLAFLNEWLALTAVLNEMSRAMGQPDFYPFVLPRPAVAKLQFIHELLRGGPVPRTALSMPPAAIPGTAG